MPTTKQIGDFFEAKAKETYLKNDYECLAENYRYGRREIDLIFKKDNLLIFVEVKYRNSMVFGYPEDWVDQKKQALIEQCANYYIEEYDWIGNFRFDIVAYQRTNNKIERRIFYDVF